MAHPRSEPLNFVDTAWLRMDDPTNLMMITSVTTFKTPLNFVRYQATLEERLLSIPRFRMRLARTRSLFEQNHWEPDPHFSLKNHLRHIALPAPGGQEALQTIVGDLMSTPLDFSRPLWQFHVIDNFGEGSAILARIHHAIADGVALVKILLSLTDATPDTVWSPPRADRPRRDTIDQVFAATGHALQATQRIVRQGAEQLARPVESIEQLTKLGVSGVGALGKLVLMSPDPRTIFKGPLQIEKRAAWSRPIPLTDVKAVGRMTHGTVNDVLLTAATGALRRYLLRRNESVENINIRAVIPVNLRPLTPAIELGNQFGLVFLSLPIGIADPFDRLMELKRRMEAIKDTPEAIVAYGILNFMGISTPQMTKMAVDLFEAKATAVMTNVPGPREPIYMAGTEVDSIMFWVPQSGRLGLGVSIFSYAEQVWLGIATDAGLVPEPDAIIAGFHEEIDDLIQLATVVEQTSGAPGGILGGSVSSLYDVTIQSSLNGKAPKAIEIPHRYPG